MIAAIFAVGILAKASHPQETINVLATVWLLKGTFGWTVFGLLLAVESILTISLLSRFWRAELIALAVFLLVVLITVCRGVCLGEAGAPTDPIPL